MKGFVRPLLAVMVIVVLVVGGCAPKPTPAPEPTQAPAAAPTKAAEKPAEKEPVKLVFWSCWNEGEKYAEVIKAWAAGYEKENPHVTVEVVFNGRENQTKLRTALAGGTKVDLMDQDAYQVAGGMVAEGLGYPVDEWLGDKAWGEDVAFRDIFVPGLLDQYKYEGKTYLIPHTLITIAFWYDKRIFRNAGVDTPTTWKEYLEACEKIKATGVAPIAQDAGVDMYNGMWYYHLVERLEGPGFLLSAVEDKTGEKWGDPAFLEAAQMIRELWDKGYIIEGAEGFTWPAGQMTLANGESSMELCGSWLPNELKEAVDPEFEWGGFAFPAVEGGKGKQTDMEAYMMSFMILKDSEHPREAFDFIRYTLTKQNAQLLADETLNASPRKDVPWPSVIADGSQMFENATATFDAFDGMQTKYSEYYSTVFITNHHQMFTGQMTPEKFIETMKVETKRYWETH